MKKTSEDCVVIVSEKVLGELWLLAFMNTNEQCFNEYLLPI